MFPCSSIPNIVGREFIGAELEVSTEIPSHSQLNIVDASRKDKNSVIAFYNFNMINATASFPFNCALFWPKHLQKKSEKLVLLQKGKFHQLLHLITE